MNINECGVAETSALDQGIVNAAYFQDSYRAGLKNSEARVQDIFSSVFGHHPMCIKQLLIFRHTKVAKRITENGTVSPNVSPVKAPKASNPTYSMEN
jgi:hypothetical protein